MLYWDSRVHQNQNHTKIISTSAHADVFFPISSYQNRAFCYCASICKLKSYPASPGTLIAELPIQYLVKPPMKQTHAHGWTWRVPNKHPKVGSIQRHLPKARHSNLSLRQSPVRENEIKAGYGWIKSGTWQFMGDELCTKQAQCKQANKPWDLLKAETTGHYFSCIFKETTTCGFLSMVFFDVSADSGVQRALESRRIFRV